MKPIFCRTGSKTPITKYIIPMIPPHEIYVEPFVGGGAVYFAGDPAPKSVINDLDKELIADYKLVKIASSDLSKYPQAIDTIEKVRRAFSTVSNTNESRLVKAIIFRCNGAYIRTVNHANDIYLSSNPISKIKNLDQYKSILKNTTITSQDYMAVIKKYDVPSTFIYLDPPYEQSTSSLYKNYLVDFEVMVVILSRIRGKFILSINDSPNIRKLFRDFTMYTLTVAGHSTKDAVAGSVARPELIIRNF
jgi:DNA adenine methylase